jgi:hypothetical protein
MFRVRAPLERPQHQPAVVAQFLPETDLGRVVARNRHRLDGREELDKERTGVLLVTKLEGSNDPDLIVHIVRNQMSRGRPGVPAPSGGAGRSTYGELIQR